MQPIDATLLLPLPLAFAAAAALLLLPLGLLANWTATAERGGERAWFAFVVRCQLFLVATVFLDVPALLGLRLERALAGADGPRALVSWTLAVLVAVTHLGAAAFAARRVRRRLRGATGAALGVRATLHALLARLSPILGLLAALVALQQGAWRMAALCSLAGFALGMWCALRQVRVLGMAPEAVTAGPLRERVFALAARAGVRVDQLFVLAAHDTRLVNAFAMQGRRVLLTDTLLERLSRREVDAVIAHELAHLRGRHAQWLVGLLTVTIAVVLPVSLPLGAWGFALCGLVGWQALLMLARSFEWAADRQAVAWTGDAEALVTAIARISRANDIPLDWGRWTGLVLTHPTTRARALALARPGALTSARAEELLVSTAEDPDRWPFVVNTAAPIVGSAARMRAALASAWGTFATGTLAATLVLLLARTFGTRWPGLAILAAGVTASWLAMLVVFDRLALASHRRWRPALVERLSPGSAARFVGLSPGIEPRLFEGCVDWDLGFLDVGAQGLVYRGERASFSLPRERVDAIEIVPGVPGWIATPRVGVRWRDERGGEHVFTLRSGDARAVHELARASSRLADELRTSLAAARDPIHARVPAAGPDAAGSPPEPEHVTSLDPWRAAGWRGVPALVLPVGLLALAAVVLANLPLLPRTGPGALDLYVAVFGGALLLRAPYLRPRRRAAAQPRALDRAA